MSGSSSGSTRGKARTNGSNGQIGNAALRRKLASTPLFRPDDDASEDSGEELPDLKTVFKGKQAVSRNATSAQASPSSTTLAKDATLYDSDAEAARKTRFETVVSENRYLQLKPLREKERRNAIAAGLIPDPLKPRKLDEALAFHATCTEMCPEFEREEREFQKNVDRWEMTPGTNRIDRHRAVKAFHRPAAGNDQPLPSDVRPPKVLKQTLDYLFHDICQQDPGLINSHPFLRDRTRAIRQDFTLQNDRSDLAIECHERIARYHILCLHVLREAENFSESQELEQLRKVLQSLNEFYEDARHEGRTCPHEAEFRAYYLITHLRDSDTIRQAELLPRDIFLERHLQAALRLHALAQRNNETRGERGRRPANSEASLNAFSRFFKAVAGDNTSYLLACLAESHFIDVRRGALSTLRKAFMTAHAHYPITKLARMLGCDDIAHCAEIAETFGFVVIYGPDHMAIAVELHKGAVMQEYPTTFKRHMSRTIVGAKKGSATIQSIVDGDFYSSHVDLKLTRKHTAKRPSLSKRQEKSISPRVVTRPSAFAIPPAKVTSTSPVPLSVPASPALAPRKAPLVPTSKGLNAAANAFTPSTGKASSGIAVSPASPAVTTFNTAVRPSIPERASSSYLSPKSSQGKPPPAASPVATTPVPLSGRPSQRSSSISTHPAAISPPSKHQSVTDKLTDKLLDRLLADSLELRIRNAAAEALGAMHAEQQAMLTSERERVIDQCAVSLLESLTDQIVSSTSVQVAFANQFNAQLLARSLDCWKRRLERARRAKIIQAKRRDSFRSLLTELGAGSSRNSQATSPKDGSLTLTQAPELSGDPFLDGVSSPETTSAALPLASTSKTAATNGQKSFWTEDSLTVLICDLVNKAFGAYALARIPEWTVLVVVPSDQATLTSWYRRKFGFGPVDGYRIDEMPHVSVNFTIVAPEALQDEPLDTVGLVIDNVTGETPPGQTISVLSERLAAESMYKAKWLHAVWRSDSNIKGFGSGIVAQIDTNDTYGGLARPMRHLLDTIVHVDHQGSEVALRILEAYKSVWSKHCQMLLADVDQSCPPGILARAFSTGIALLRTMREELLGFVAYSEDVVSEWPPPFDASTVQDGPSLLSTLDAYLRDTDLAADAALSTLRYNFIKEHSCSAVNVRQLLDRLVEVCCKELADASPTLRGQAIAVQAGLEWWEQIVEDQTQSLSEALAKFKNIPGRKRHRDLLEHETASSPPTNAKKSRDAMEQWLPERITSLKDLLQSARSLLDTQNHNDVRAE